MKERKLLHKRILALIVTFMMMFMSVPAGVFADEQSEKEAVDAAVEYIEGLNFTPDATVIDTTSASAFASSVMGSIRETFNVGTNKIYDGKQEPTVETGGFYSFHMEIVGKPDNLYRANTRTITINIPALPPASSDATLFDLKVNGSKVDGFNSSTTEYNMTVPYETTEIRITATTTDPGARTYINGVVYAPVGTTEYTVTVTAEDNETEKIYTINVTRTAAPPTDAEAVAADKEALTWDNFKGSNTAIDGVTDNLSFPSDGSSGTTITWTTDSNEVITDSGVVTRPTYTQGDKTVIVTAAITKNEATVTKEFTLIVLKADPSNDATLKTFAIDGGSVPLTPTFTANTTAYYAAVPYESYEIAITAEKNNDYASLSGDTENKLLDVGENTVTVTVTAEDGTIKTYTIIVTRQQQVFDKPLVLKSDGIYYDDVLLSASDSKLGGGSYTWNSGTKTLIITNVNFTTAAQTAFELTVFNVNLVINGTNSFTSTYNSYYYTRGIVANGTLTVSGDGSLSVESGDTILEYINGLRIQAGTLVINSGTVTITAGSSVNSVSYGIYGSVIVNGGNLTVTGNDQAIFSGTGTINMPTYSWNDGSSSGTYPSSALTLGTQTYIAISAATGVTPTTAAFNKATPANIELTYSLETGETLDNITIGENTLTSSDYTIEDNIITILSTYLDDLDNDTYTLTLNTSDDVNPEVTLTVANFYDKGLVLQSDGLYYNGTKLTTSDSKLGGGSYTYTGGVLALNGVNFTSAAAIALDLTQVDGVKISISNTNYFTTTSAVVNAFGIEANSFSVEGSGSITATGKYAGICINSGKTFSLLSGTVTVTGNTSGIHGSSICSIAMSGGVLNTSGGSHKWSNIASPVVYPAAYTWTSDTGSGSMPGGTAPTSTKSLTITTETAVTPATAVFNKATPANIVLTYSLAPGTSIQSITNGDYTLAATGLAGNDYVITDNTITIKSDYLKDLANDTYTFKINTSGDVDPEVTISVTKIYDKSLVLKTADTVTGLYYNDALLAANDEKLGGGSYSWNAASNTLTLN
ncbi:MAG: cadherin-like beta sandwich domain-containing protein, partial [Ruminococcus sp.]|nr:cadherin-like beta sandwich domain-containing protein [Ruminococcus sp.]